MTRFRFALAVLGTSLALVLGLGAVGAFAVSTAFANGFGPFGGPFGPHAIPPEFQGLEQLTPAERFKHFSGAQINLRDKDNKPVAINATPGAVTSVSGTSLTIAGNDGSNKTFTLDDKTVIRGKPDTTTPGNRPAATTLKQGDLVVVVTTNGETLARFVMSGGTDGFGPPAGGGPFRGPFGGGGPFSGR
ncbi:MAG: hypothetical protein IT306_16845 [Chloroflexi bacterium]|nr:hypothetical protein [Chloroflexota bacterium]